MSSTQQVLYRKGRPTATPILIYEDTRREVVQQCIANLMSTFHVYPHRLSPVPLPIGLRTYWLRSIALIGPSAMPANTGNHREKFVEHLGLFYPQLSNAADKSYLDMIRNIPFQYDLKNPVVELRFQAELFRIVKYYDSLTLAEEAEAVKILMGKINIPTVFNWIPVFNEMATSCDVPAPVDTVDALHFVLEA